MKRKILVMAAVALVLPMASADAQWVFVARKAAQRIHHMSRGRRRRPAGLRLRLGGARGAGRQSVRDRARARAEEPPGPHPDRPIPVARRLQVAEGDRTATLNVVELNEAGLPAPDRRPDRSRRGRPPPRKIVAAVMRICTELGKTCELGR